MAPGSRNQHSVQSEEGEFVSLLRDPMARGSGLRATRPLRSAAGLHTPEYWHGFYNGRTARADWFAADPSRVAALAKRVARPRRADVDYCKKGKLLLDIGCGTSPLGLEVLASLPGSFALLGVDIETAALDLARQRVPSHLAGRVNYRRADVLASGELAGVARDLHTEGAAIALDKGTLDAFIHVGDHGKLAAAYMAEVASSVAAGGTFVHVTDEPPELRLDLLADVAPAPAWGRPRFAGSVAPGEEDEESGVFAYTLERQEDSRPAR